MAGILKRIKKGVTEKIEEGKQERLEKKEAFKSSRKRARTAYYSAMAQQQEKYAMTKARVEGEAQERKLRAKYSAKKEGFFAGINLGVKPQSSQRFQQSYFKSGGMINPLLSSTTSKSTKKRKKKRKGKN